MKPFADLNVFVCRDSIIMQGPENCMQNKHYCAMSAPMLSTYFRILTCVLMIFLMSQSGQSDHDEDDGFSSKGPSWFRKQYWDKGSKRDQGNAGPQSRSWSKGASTFLLITCAL
ncbi:hypothetical protein CK203_077150 [Vitis vinifera]|uniref:Uncharacterized protein n=1 Tax=Vitis vinifera TaxID=29760 RepID=A0A438D5L3_VITVI|nr:hypothetical protein CK203_077150 [Vitis vinifera]